MADDQDERTSDEDAKGLRKLLEDTKAELARVKADGEAVKQQATRDAAFAKAGIPDSKLGEMFRKSYDGELTAEAIKAQALDVGLVQQERQTSGDERDQLISLQSDQAPGDRPADRSVVQDLTTKIAAMDGADSGDILDLIRSVAPNLLVG